MQEKDRGQGAVVHDAAVRDRINTVRTIWPQEDEDYVNRRPSDLDAEIEAARGTLLPTPLTSSIG